MDVNSWPLNSIPTTGKTIFTIIFGTSALVAALANTFCLIVLWQPSQRSTPNTILKSLAVSDCLVGYICLPLLIWRINVSPNLQDTQMTSWVNFIFGIMIIWILTCSTFSIVFVAFERYIHITKPQRYHDILLKRRVNFIIALFWVVDLPLCVGSVIEIRVYYITSPPYLIITTVILCACYYYIWKTVRESQRRIASHSHNVRQDRRRQNRLTKKVLMLVLVYLIIFVFSVVYTVCRFLISKQVILVSQELKIYALLVTYFVVTSNSCLNPMIYIWKDPEFKAACKRLLIRMKCKTKAPVTASKDNNIGKATSSV